MSTKVATNTTYVNPFKFPWIATAGKIIASDRPVNELDKKPGEVDATSIEQLAADFLSSPQCEYLLKQLNKKEYKNTKRPQSYSRLPYAAKIKALLLLSCLSLQRPINYKHLIKIILNWDSRRPSAVNVLKLPNQEVYYITDGQHTVLAHVIRAALGLFPDYEGDALDIEINCLVVEDDDFAFAREHFLGINGDDKLKLAAFDKWKNKVLAKRQDSPDQETEESYEIACEKQEIMESFNVIPVHSASEDVKKAGALVDVHLLKTINADDLEFICENHNTYWPDAPVDSMELAPLQELKEKCIARGAKLESAEFKDFMKNLNTVVKTATGGWSEFKNLTQVTWRDYHKEAWDEEWKGEPPSDASLVLLLKMYRAAGGEYKKIPNNLISKYSDNGADLFEALDVELKKAF